MESDTQELIINRKPTTTRKLSAFDEGAPRMHEPFDIIRTYRYEDDILLTRNMQNTLWPAISVPGGFRGWSVVVVRLSYAATWAHAITARFVEPSNTWHRTKPQSLLLVE